MPREQLDEIEKLARDPKSAAFHDLMARQTIPLVKALREALAKHNEALDMCQRYMGHLHKALKERDEARAEVERLREVVGQVHALANEAVRGTAVWEPLVEIHEITKGMVE